MNLCRRWRLLAWLCVVPWLLLCPELFAQVNGTITSTGCLSIATGAQATVTFQVTGSWSGTIQPEVSVQGQAAVNTQVAPSTSTTLQSTVTANGAYSASVAGYDTFLLCGNTVTGTAKVYINSTTARGGGNSGGGGGSGTVTSVDGSGQNGVETESGDTPGAITTSGVVRGTLVARTVSTNTPLLASDRGKAIQLGGLGGFTLTLPTSGAGFVSGYEVYLKQLSSASPWTLSPATGTIDGQASISFFSTSSDRPTTVLLRFDGTNWFSSFTAPQLWQNTGNLVFASSATGAGSMLLRKLVTADLPSTVANTALSNLASVAINTDLLPGVDNSIALGSASFRWSNVFAQAVTASGTITSTLGTITTSTPAWSGTQTWNASGVAFTGWVENITDTAKANGSKLFDLEAGSSSVFTVQWSSTNSTYQALFPLGGVLRPGIAFQGDAGTGFKNASGSIYYVSGGAYQAQFGIGSLELRSGIGFSISSGDASAAYDTVLCRSSAGVWEFGTTACNASGSFLATNGTFSGTETAALQKNSSPCLASGTAANPSVVTCGASASGVIYCDVAASAGTCTVNTTAVTTAAVIGIFPNTADGTALSKTCNASPTVVPTQWLSAKSNGVSFTVNMPTETVNGECFEYVIYSN